MLPRYLCYQLEFGDIKEITRNVLSQPCKSLSSEELQNRFWETEEEASTLPLFKKIMGDSWKIPNSWPPTCSRLQDRFGSIPQPSECLYKFWHVEEVTAHTGCALYSCYWTHHMQKFKSNLVLQHVELLVQKLGFMAQLRDISKSPQMK